jgi:phage antirepressor YoqD-like protein
MTIRWFLIKNEEYINFVIENKIMFGTDWHMPMMIGNAERMSVKEAVDIGIVKKTASSSPI